MLTCQQTAAIERFLEISYETDARMRGPQSASFHQTGCQSDSGRNRDCAMRDLRSHLAHRPSGQLARTDLRVMPPRKAPSFY